jgi:acetolactate decarboxylase
MQKPHGPNSTLALLEPVWHHLVPASSPGTGALFQTSLMAALLGGVYEGTLTYGDLHHRGDFGLGTFNGLDGEMVGFGGIFYQVRSDGSATLVNDDQKTPFAIVTFFRPEQRWNIEKPISKDTLQAAIEAETDSNLFAAVKVTGIFERISTRTVQRQHKPYPPLTDAAAHQAENTFDNVSGTLAGFRTPSFAQGIGVAGFHLHFLRGDRLAGGHVLDYLLRTGTVEIQILRSFHVELPDSKEFLETPLSGPSVDAGIKASEG